MDGLKVTTGPTFEPVTLAEAKARLQITIDDLDGTIAAMLAESRAQAEAECGRAFATQTFTLYLDGFPRGKEIRLPRPPLQSVTSVKYYDTAGVLQTLSSSSYHVATAGEPGRVVLAADTFWPATEYGRPEAVEIKYVAGHTAPTVPAAVKAAILLILAERYENPSGAVAIPPAARRVLDTLETGQVW